MNGKYVELDGFRVWVWCCPDTPPEELRRRAVAVIARVVARFTPRAAQ